MSRAPFFPEEVFAPAGTGDAVPRVFASPSRYIQGPGVLRGMGRYLGLLGARRAGILASARAMAQEAGELAQILSGAELGVASARFAGECSIAVIEAAAAELREAHVDVLLAVGGGKCVDAGKCVASRLQLPVVVVPTLASNDAPCSALSVLYSDAGSSVGAEFFPASPALVVVDTQLIAAAPERYLAAGMGDAMATWYEARVCLANPAARNALGARPTLASCVIGERCAHTLFDHGLDAAQAVRDGKPDDALEDVVEANTLLSGIGFESGGLAAAHGVAQGYTALDGVAAHFLHGELVAMGLLTQLMLQGDHDEAERVGRFFTGIGLPVCLGQLGLGGRDPGIEAMITAALEFPPLHNMPDPTDRVSLAAAVQAADRLGESLRADLGQAAFQRLQS